MIANRQVPGADMSHSIGACCRCALPRRIRQFGILGPWHGAVVLIALAAVFRSSAAADDQSASSFDVEEVLDSSAQLHAVGFPLDDSVRLASPISTEQWPQAMHSVAPREDYNQKATDEEGPAEDEEEDDDDQIAPLVEELFLGTIVYPQEKNEVQLTFGYFDDVDADGNSAQLFELEYGITDRFQIGLEVPIESVEDEEPFDGVRQLGLELYYNFYNNRCRGRAYGMGLEIGFPVDSAGGEPREFAYEPFFVAYQEYRAFALNMSAALEVEDPVDSDEAAETAGEIAFGLIGRRRPIVPLLELQVEIASEETPVLLAPGLYGSSLLRPFDVAVSFPIGLNDDAPDFGVFFLAVLEFELGEIGRNAHR
jgi:hypothetical protein